MIWAPLLSGVRRLLVGKPVAEDASLFDQKAETQAGVLESMSAFKGKKILIVNTASKCVYTSQLQELELLHQQYHHKVHVLGFPSNDFWQDRGTDEEIASFCLKNYGVTFPMFRKVHVTGRDMHPVFRVLFGKSGRVPQWNFCKYLLDENGNFIRFFTSKVSPLDRKITSLLK